MKNFSNGLPFLENSCIILGFTFFTKKCLCMRVVIEFRFSDAVKVSVLCQVHSCFSDKE